MSDVKQLIVFDYSKLRGLMAEKEVTQRDLAHQISLSRTTLNRKLTKGDGFHADHIFRICTLLNISQADVGLYFFNRQLTTT